MEQPMNRRNRWRRWTLSLVALAAAAALSAPLAPSYATEVSPAAGGALTLREAREAALANHPELKLAQEQLELAETRYNDILEDLPYAKNRKSNDAAQEASYRRQELVAPIAAEADVLELRTKVDDTRLKVRLETDRLFYEHAIAAAEAAALADRRANAERALEAQRKLVDAGRATVSSLQPFELEVLNVELRELELEGRIDLIRLDLGAATGLAPGRLAKLETLPMPEANVPATDLAATAAALKTKHPSVALAVKRAESAAAEYVIMQKAYKYDDDMLLDVKTAEDNAFGARLAVRDAETQVETRLLSDYNGLLNFRDAVRIAELDFDRASKALDMREKQRELGLITDTELNDARTQAQDAATALQRAKLDLYLAVERFEHFVSSAAP